MLTLTEKTLIRHLSNGLTMRKAAKKMDLTYFTCVGVIGNCRTKTGTKSMAHLVNYCWENGLIKKNECGLINKVYPVHVVTSELIKKSLF